MNNNKISVNQEKGSQQRLDTIIGRNIECRLDELGIIRLIQVESAADKKYALWKAFIENYHYIGHGKLYGFQIRYLIESENYGWIGALSFSSAAWKLQARDNWVGWSDENRVKHLNEVACNSRFLILPNVRVNNLASHILSISLRQLKQDWMKKYKIEPLLVETFVEKERFSGTCYQAANFHYIGTTQGRGRQDRENEHALPVKDIYLYPLGSDIKEQLCAGQPIKSPSPAFPVDWTEEELGEADFGDERLKRFFRN
ncbi:DUF4338 domain-containing protein [bacterium]|nr:DUF4338 domain-containing protein [bacterium]